MTNLDPLVVRGAELARRLPAACIRLSEQRSGYPAGGGAMGSGGESRVEALVVARDEHGAHISDRDYRKLEKLIDQLEVLVRAVVPNQRAADHLASKADGSCPAGCCESCFRDAGHRTPTRTEGSRLCRWCENWCRELNLEVPPLMLVRLHHTGKRITDRDVRLATGGKHG